MKACVKCGGGENNQQHALLMVPVSSKHLFSQDYPPQAAAGAATNERGDRGWHCLMIRLFDSFY
jgi:hypothetical protein